MNLLHLKIITPDRLYFEGDVTSVRASDEDGEFEILPQHAGMISTLRAGKLVVVGAGDKKALLTKGGFVEIISDQATILVDGIDEA